MTYLVRDNHGIVLFVGDTFLIFKVKRHQSFKKYRNCLPILVEPGDHTFVENNTNDKVYELSSDEIDYYMWMDW